MHVSANGEVKSMIFAWATLKSSSGIYSLYVQQ